LDERRLGRFDEETRYEGHSLRLIVGAAFIRAIRRFHYRHESMTALAANVSMEQYRFALGAPNTAFL
jgi:hypothetical protein